MPDVTTATMISEIGAPATNQEAHGRRLGAGVGDGALALDTIRIVYSVDDPVLARQL
jgi:hypothetical protein